MIYLQEHYRENENEKKDEYINSLEEELLEIRGLLNIFIEAHQMPEGILKRARIRGVMNDSKKYMEGKETIKQGKEPF